MIPKWGSWSSSIKNTAVAATFFISQSQAFEQSCRDYINVIPKWGSWSSSIKNAAVAATFLFPLAKPSSKARA
ncbi:hypothetical protein CHX27_04835 [Flavobacterium aurantiibacter]|uniref:Uncharacterized protein n=1 Tax=Flavobacterium aurantiibacter TaxID=2023067 RepID=A0A255ZZ50_9FLAO|nr:hypothetical protein CHX27_04835 [Flavobacterium aurantiibacter]